MIRLHALQIELLVEILKTVIAISLCILRGIVEHGIEQEFTLLSICQFVN